MTYWLSISDMPSFGAASGPKNLDTISILIGEFEYE
jgi:hypothetical protein